MKATLSAHNGDIDNVSVQRLAENGVWRVSVPLQPKNNQAVDLRCYLTLYGEALTETLDLPMDAMNASPTHTRSRSLAASTRRCWRRILFFGLTFADRAGRRVPDARYPEANGLTPLEWLALLMFLVLFTWISGAFWTGIAGFVVRLIGHDPAVLHPSAGGLACLAGRTAIVIADLQRGYGARVRRRRRHLGTRCSSSRGAGAEFRFLHPVRYPQGRDRARGRARLARAGRARRRRERLFYRRRADNVGRKSGNIAEFVRNWGGAYDYMIVLDADSIMSGQALVSLAQLMDAHPEVGIIQALPLLAGRDTLFARMLQFAVRLNGPMFASGLAFWQLGESNYWGHNAIMRLRPFAEHCALPRLPGSPPFGGEILSHDIVEAAFMRRAGYKVWLVPDIAGSWEESALQRHRLRGARSALGAGQSAAHRCDADARPALAQPHAHADRHSLLCDLADVAAGADRSARSSPAWRRVSGHQYFQPGTYSLFPTWPQYRDGEIAALLCMTIIGAAAAEGCWARCLALSDRAAARRLRRRPQAPAAASLLEQLLSMLLAPTMMLFHSELRAARTARPQRRLGCAGARRSRRELARGLRRHAGTSAIGLVWGGAILDPGAGLHLVDDAGDRRHADRGALHGADQPRRSGRGAAPTRTAADTRRDLPAAGAGRCSQPRARAASARAQVRR